MNFKSLKFDFLFVKSDKQNIKRILKLKRRETITLIDNPLHDAGVESAGADEAGVVRQEADARHVGRVAAILVTQRLKDRGLFSGTDFEFLFMVT